MRYIITLFQCWLMGFRECRSDFGMTWEHPDSPRSRAYDFGRSFGQWLWRVK